jgi:hypothetical protein
MHDHVGYQYNYELDICFDAIRVVLLNDLIQFDCPVFSLCCGRYFQVSAIKETNVIHYTVPMTTKYLLSAL